jgi:aryl-alcohol dehydrogenase-like predicted oxidoreductase
MENEYLEIFKNIGMGTTIWSPLASGLLTGKYNKTIPKDSRLAMEGFGWLKDKTISDERIEKVKKLSRIAKALDTTTGVLSISWCIKNPNVTTAILGATKKEQLTENLKAIEVVNQLTPELMGKIDGIMGTKPTLPEF